MSQYDRAKETEGRQQFSDATRPLHDESPQYWIVVDYLSFFVNGSENFGAGEVTTVSIGPYILWKSVPVVARSIYELGVHIEREDEHVFVHPRNVVEVRAIEATKEEDDADDGTKVSVWAE